MYSILTTANNTILFTWHFLREWIPSVFTTHRKKGNGIVWLWSSFHNVSIYQDIPLCTFNIYNFICQSHLNKAGGKKHFGYVAVTAHLQGAPNFTVLVWTTAFTILFSFLLVCFLVYLFLPYCQVIICNIFLLLMCPSLASCSPGGKHNTWPMGGAYSRQNNSKKTATS